MNILTLDFETYFDDDYSLRKMTTEAYVRDARFEALGVGARTANGQLGWVPQEEVADFFSLFNWSHTVVLAHHAHFDGLILAHHYNIRPKMWLDTLSMARLMLGNHVSVALKSLAMHYGLEDKNVPYEKFKGKRWHQIGVALRKELGDGCVHDVELTYSIFGKLYRGER